MTTTNDFSVDIASLPIDQYPLDENEENVFKLFFYPEFEQKQKMIAQTATQPENKEIIKEENSQPKRTFFKKLLFALIATSILLIHAITPLSSLVKVLTSKPVFAVATVLVYIIVMYFIIEKI